MATKRYFKIPAPIVLLDPSTDEPICDVGADGGKGAPAAPISFDRFLKRAILGDPRFCDGWVGICARGDIIAAVKEADGGVVVLDEDDWKLLEGAVDYPQQSIGGQKVAGYGGWVSIIMPQFRPFLAAVKNASSEAPAAALAAVAP